MKEKLAALWAKAVENKEVLIRVGGIAAGVVVGAVVATVIANMQNEQDLMFYEEDETQIDAPVEVTE